MSARSEYRRGLRVEREHLAAIGGDRRALRRLVRDHLREHRDYYSRLARCFGKKKNPDKPWRRFLQGWGAKCPPAWAYEAATREAKRVRAERKSKKNPARSPAQRRLFGAALAWRRGRRCSTSARVRKLANSRRTRSGRRARVRRE